MKLKIVFLIFSILITIVNIPLVNSSFDQEYNIFISVLSVVNILFFINYRVRKNKYWISLENLFLLGYIFVHFQIPFSHALGWEPVNSNYIFINKNVVNYAVWLSSLAILLFLGGFYWYDYKVTHKKTDIKKTEITKKQLTRLKFLIVVLFPLFVFLVGSKFLAGTYDGGNNWGAGASYVYLLLHVSIILYLALVLLYIPQKKSITSVFISVFKFSTVTSILIATYLFIFLLAGDRGPVIQILILLFFFINYKHVKIKLPKFIFLIIVGATLMTIVKYGRTGGTETRGNTDIFTHGLQELNTSDTDFNPTLELASSNRILFQAVNTVPDKHEYLYGITMFGDLAAGIPFLSGVLKREFSLPTIYFSSTYFFTYIGQGNNPTYGEGSEIIADIYINFGIIGVVFVMFFMGVFLSYLSINFDSSNSFLFTLFLSLVISSIYWNRSPLFSFFQQFILLLFIYKLISSEKRKV